jgi:hypothetical protein
MSVMRFAAGDPAYWSSLARALTTPTVSPAEDALFPASNLKLYDPMKPFRFGSWSATPTITVDLVQNTDGGLESWSAGVPVGFTAGGAGGTLTQVTSGTGQVHGGTYAAKLVTDGLGRVKILAKDFTMVRSGASWHLDFYYFGNGVSAGTWTAQNLTTGKSWDGSAWVDAGAASYKIALTSTAAWNHLSADIPVESYQDCGRNDTVTLRININSPNAANGVVYIDDVFGWPVVDVAAVIGHTFSAHTLTLRGSTDNFSSSDVSLGVVPTSSHSTYLLLGSSQNYRYYRLSGAALSALVGSLTATAPFVGQFVLAQTQALTPTPLVDWGIDRRMPQVRNETRGRAIRASRLGRWPVRDLQLEFQLRSQAYLDEVAVDMVERSGYGQYPCSSSHTTARRTSCGVDPPTSFRCRRRSRPRRLRSSRPP